jgi:Uma2 family endonuclease
MTTAIQVPDRPAIEYPESDGLPIAENTRQFQWIGTIMWGLDAMFLDEPNVFVAGDLLWYPVEGEPTIRVAPDALVAFGRPKGYRGSYRQWEEGNVAPHVVFEVLSPGNRPAEMENKFQFYERHGVEEYYIYDPDDGTLDGWLRAGDRLEKIPRMAGFVSPRLSIRFEPGEGPDNLGIYRPDGTMFLTVSESIQNSETERQRADEEHRRAVAERQRADEEHRRAEAERQRADEEGLRAETERQRAETERQRAEAESQRAERLAARLRELGIEPE